jgi:5-methylcytosine-specific restriction endonuclease McrA
MTNNKKLNAEHVWKQFEDLLAPQLNFSPADRAVYSHLFRHSRLVGTLRFRFSMPWLASHIRLSQKTTRESVRSLIARGVLRLLERSCQAHHVVYVRLPHEVSALRAAQTAAPVRPSTRTSSHASFAETDFFQTRQLRGAIHAREGGRCFYCLRRLIRQRRCLDHVVPKARLGGNTYRNLVSCCLDCNTHKTERSAVEFVRSLYRDRRLSSDELTARLRAIDDLAAGKLKPTLPGQERAASIGSSSATHAKG